MPRTAILDYEPYETETELPLTQRVGPCPDCKRILRMVDTATALCFACKSCWGVSLIVKLERR